MSCDVVIRNRQRRRRVDTRLLRRIVLDLTAELLRVESGELGVTVVATPEMARLNWQFLQHEGSTDVITFDHTDGQESRRRAGRIRSIHGELYICVDDAVQQAKSFRTIWQAELLRYVVHGILHLLGHDDHHAARRRRMKLEENRIMRALMRRYPLQTLGE